MGKLLGMVKKNWFVIVVLCVVSATLAIMMNQTKPQEEIQKVPSKKVIATQMHTPFVATAEITFNDVVIVGDFEKQGKGKGSLLINSPRSLKGVKFSYDNAIASVSYNGFDFEVTNDSKLLNTAIKYMIDSIDIASDPSQVTIQNDRFSDNLIVTGNHGKSQFNISLDKTNTINSITLPDVNLSIKLTRKES